MRHRKEMLAEPDSRRSHIPSCLHTCSCDEASEKLLMQMTKIWLCDDVTFTFYGRRRRLNGNVWDQETLADTPHTPRPKKQSPPASQKPADVYIPAITTSSQWGERSSMSLSCFCFTPHTAHNFENRASLKWISTICVCERELQMYSFATLSHIVCTRVHNRVHWRVFAWVSAARDNKCVSSCNVSLPRRGSWELSSASVPQDKLQLSPRGHEKQSERSRLPWTYLCL